MGSLPQSKITLSYLMKLPLFLFSYFFSAFALFSQVVAIVTVEAFNPDRDEQFVIELDIDNAPLNVANFMILADPSLDYFRNSGFATFTNNPAGRYKPSNEDGALLPGGGEIYSIFVNDSQAVFHVNEGSIATVFRTANLNQVAQFRLINGTWVYQPDPFSPFTFRLNYNNTFSSWALEVDTSVTYLDEFDGSLTTGPFYTPQANPEIISVIEGDHPYLSIGRKDLGVNRPPGWVIQNEVIDRQANNIDSPQVFGYRFANLGGTAGASQRYAVAFANNSLTTPNTASSELLITGILGNPSFEGRHTYIGKVIEGAYSNAPTFIGGSRALVDSLINGTRIANLKSIRFENLNTSFAPIDFGRSLPLVSSQASTAVFDFSDPNSPRLLTGATAGQIRFLDGSTDLINWGRIGSSSFPSNASEEIGYSLTNVIEPFPKQFFRVNPIFVTYPSWPSESFNYPGRQIRFKGREVDVPGAPQVLNNFIINFDNSPNIGTLTGNGGDLDGVHSLNSIDYKATGPFTGEITMESNSLPEPLKLRLYFDAHKLLEINSGVIIDRFHRLADRVVTTPVGDFLFRDQIQEFGLWTIQN